jgi:hypothetical protein
VTDQITNCCTVSSKSDIAIEPPCQSPSGQRRLWHICRRIPTHLTSFRTVQCNICKYIVLPTNFCNVSNKSDIAIHPPCRSASGQWRLWRICKRCPTHLTSCRILQCNIFNYVVLPTNYCSVNSKSDIVSQPLRRSPSSWRRLWHICKRFPTHSTSCRIVQCNIFNYIVLPTNYCSVNSKSDIVGQPRRRSSPSSWRRLRCICERLLTQLRSCRIVQCNIFKCIVLSTNYCTISNKSDLVIEPLRRSASGRR